MRYTYLGDCNLDGQVDDADFSLFVDGYNGVGSGWVYGDFNYDGAIDDNDFSLFVDGWNLQGASLPDKLIQPATTLSATTPNAQAYSVQPYALAAGVTQYGDRSDTFLTVPGKYLGATLLRTADADARTVTPDLLSVALTCDSMVYILHNDAYTAKPSWLGQFADTGDHIVTTHGTFSVYLRSLSTGRITLGSNTDNGLSDYGMYSVLVLPLL